jgi:hypothetical protein
MRRVAIPLPQVVLRSFCPRVAADPNRSLDLKQPVLALIQEV